MTAAMRHDGRFESRADGIALHASPEERRRMLYPELLERAGSAADRLPKVPPEVRPGLMYTNDGWVVRRWGLVLPDRIQCRNPDRLAPHHVKLQQRPREMVHHCTHHPDRGPLHGKAQPMCNTPIFVVGFRPPYVWAMDISAHEEAIVSLLGYEELLDWFQVGFPTLERRAS